jgi:hypothetical protein
MGKREHEFLIKKPKLSHGGTIQVDYGYLDRTVSKVKENNIDTCKGEDDSDKVVATMFYTRQLYLNVMITVYRNLEPFNWDVVYLRHSTPASQEVLNQSLKRIKVQEVLPNKTVSLIQNQPVEDLLIVTRNIEIEQQERNEYCLLTLDVRNIWTMPFNVVFTIDNKGPGETNENNELESRITIQPGSTSR